MVEASGTPHERWEPPTTLGVAIARVLTAYDALVVTGESVLDEWPYVTDLAAAWRARLGVVAAGRPDDPLAPAVAAAIEAVTAEIARIADPHRAIDWLSSYPQVVLLALGERP